MNTEFKTPKAGGLSYIGADLWKVQVQGSSAFNLILKIFNSKGKEKSAIMVPAKEMSWHLTIEPNDYIQLQDEQGTKLNLTDPETIKKYKLKFSIGVI